MKKRLVLLRKNEKKSTVLLLVLLLLCSGCLIYRDYLFGNRLLVFGDMAGDTLDQYIPRYISIVNHIRQGSFSFWNFEEGFGISQLCINLFDPSLLLTFLTGILFGIEAMLKVLPWMQLVRIVLSGLACYGFLSQFSFSRQARLSASYVYGLSGFLIIWGQHYQFGMVTVYLPLLLLLAERSIQKKKGKALLPVMVFLSCVYGVYLTYMSLIGVGFFLLFRCMSLEDKSWRERMGRFLHGCLQILLGIGMSMVFFLPQAFTIVGISFRTNHDSMSVLEWLKMAFLPYEDNIGSFYRSVLTRIFSTNLENRYPIAGYDFTGWFNYFEAPVLFFSTLFPFLAVHFLWRYRKVTEGKWKKASVYLPVLLVLVTVLLPVGGMVFNGFLTPVQRYTFVLFPFLAMVFAWSWDDIRSYGKTNLLLSFVVFCLANAAYRRGAGESCFPTDYTNAVLLGVLAELLLLLLMAMTVLKRENIRSIGMSLLAVLLVINMVSEGSASLSSRLGLLKEDTPLELYEEREAQYQADMASPDGDVAIQAVLNPPQKYFRDLEDADMQAALSWIREHDPEFCRVERDYTVMTRCMDSLIYDYPGVSCYNSIVNGYVQQFWNQFCPEIYYLNIANMAFWQVAEKNELAAFLGIRYLISQEEKAPESGYEKVGQFGKLWLYQNAAPASVAHYYCQAASLDSLAELEKNHTKEEILQSVLLLEEGPVRSELPEEKTEGEISLLPGEKDSHLTGTAHVEEDGYALFMIPYEKGWELKIDGEKTDVTYGDLGFLACELPAGEHTLELTYVPPFVKEGLIISLVFWLLYAAALLYTKKRLTR